MTANVMQIAIANLFGYRKHMIVPNISFGFFQGREADMLIVRGSGYFIEVEIKTTVVDMRKDLSKNHRHDNTVHGQERTWRKNPVAKELYFAFPSDIIDKCEPIVSEHYPHAGIITVHKPVSYKHANGSLDSDAFASYHRRAGDDSRAEKLTPEQIINLGRLGCMRIWSLKEKLIKRGNHG